jgi:hypothetical protein
LARKKKTVKKKEVQEFKEISLDSLGDSFEDPLEGADVVEPIKVEVEVITKKEEKKEVDLKRVPGKYLKLL